VYGREGRGGVGGSGRGRKEKSEIEVCLREEADLNLCAKAMGKEAEKRYNIME
jgi:hypothetical protein